MGSSIVLIFITSVLEPSFRSPDLIQYFLHDLGHLMILASALTLVLLVGQLDLGLAGYYFLAVSLLRIALSKLYVTEDYFSGISVGLLICFGFAALGMGMGWLISLKQKLGLLLSLGLGLVTGSIAFFIRDAYPTWTDPLFEGRTPIPPEWLLAILYALCIFASVQAVRYFWPKWDFLMALIPIWVAMLLFHFVVIAYGGLPLAALVSVFVIFFVYFLLHHTGFGRAVHAAGFNTEAARLCGINLRKLSISVFAISFFLVAISGLFERAPLNSHDFEIPLFRHLMAFAACVIGGVSVRGGFGCISNAIAGALFLGTWWVSCEQLGFPIAVFVMGVGVLLMLSVVFEPSRVERSLS